MNHLSITFGALAAPLAKQLEFAALTKRDFASFQKDADAVTRLLLRGLLTDAQGRAARQKIVNKIHKRILS